MKTTNFQTSRDLDRCPNFKHLSLAIILTVLVPSAVLASELLIYKATNTPSRNPAAVEEEVLTVPLEENFVMDSLFAEDDAGVMRGMKDSLAAWEKEEEYRDTWDLQSTGLHNTPDTRQKRKFIASKLLRYADKRFSGEMKKASEGSTLHKVSKVEKQLRPNASVPVSKYVSLKFRARVLQGKAIVEVKNPWVDCNATVAANGKAKMVTSKTFKEIGMSSGAEYTFNESQWLAYVDQEVSKNIKARVSSTQKGSGNPFSNDADARVEMTASFPFNL